jgi:ATP-dependent Clp protease, protease subunit
VLVGSVVPMVVEQDGRWERSFDIYSRLLRERIVFLGQEVDDQIANLIAAQLLHLDAQDPGTDIYLYVNSPGGSAYAGMAIYDAMQYVQSDVSTVCLGMGMSAAAMILSGGAAGKRFALPNAKIMIHQGSGGFRGTPADIQIAAREILDMTRRMAEIISRHSGQDVEQVLRDIDRDRFMSPQDAVDYGLVDAVMEPRSLEPAGRRPVGEQHGPDEARLGHGSPHAGVAGVHSVVAHEEVPAGRHLPRVRDRVPQFRIDVRLVERLAVDRDVAVPLRHGVSGEADQPLDERAADPAGGRGRVEDDDLPTLRAPEAVGEPVGDHAVVETALAPRTWFRAVERRLHRGGGDAIRLGDLGLEHEHEQESDADRHHPVENLPQPPRHSGHGSHAPRVDRGARRAFATTRSTACLSGPGTALSPV